MNAKKSVAYCKLVENVKNKYRKNPIYTKNLTLGWCDLRQGENLCQEINLWTYWQGRNYARKTPHIKYMLIGQDFGPPEKEEIKGTIANVRKMNDGIDAMFHLFYQVLLPIKQLWLITAENLLMTKNPARVISVII